MVEIIPPSDEERARILATRKRNGVPYANERDKELGFRLDQYRLAAGVTVKELAKACGVHMNQIYKNIKGEDRIPVIRLIDACAYIGVSLNDLTAGLEVTTRMDPLPESYHRLLNLHRNFLAIEDKIVRDSIYRTVERLAKGDLDLGK